MIKVDPPIDVIAIDYLFYDDTPEEMVKEIHRQAKTKLFSSLVDRLPYAKSVTLNYKEYHNYDTAFDSFGKRCKKVTLQLEITKG